MVQRAPSWILVLPLLFFACHGVFSFQSEGEAVGGFLPGAVNQTNKGILGYVVFPGITFSIVLWHMRAYWSKILIYARYLKLLTCLALITILSALWSQNSLRSIEFGMFYLLGTCFAYYLVIRFEPAEVMSLMGRASLILCMLSVIIAIGFPKWGIDIDLRSPGSWRGIFVNRTTAAKELIFLLSPVLVSWRERGWVRNLLLIGLPLLVIIKAHAVTGFVVLPTYCIFLGLLHFSRGLERKLSSAFVVAMCVFGVVACVLGVEYVPDLIRAMGRDPTLTGRTVIWAEVIRAIGKHPFLGYGFYSFWQGLTGESGNIIMANHWSFGYAHNGTLEIFLQMGWFGVIVFYLTLFQAIRNAWYCFQHDSSGNSDWYISLIALTILYNLDDASVLLPNEMASILYVVACCGLAQIARRIKKSKPYIVSRSAHVDALSLAR
jgi:exopolysaccharide production protein ExoQ